MSPILTAAGRRSYVNIFETICKVTTRVERFHSQYLAEVLADSCTSRKIA